MQISTRIPGTERTGMARTGMARTEKAQPGTGQRSFGPLPSLSQRETSLDDGLKNELGFTLMEVGVVIVLLLIMTTVAASRFGMTDRMRQNSELRHFINTWEMVQQTATGKGDSYRLVLDLDRAVYYVKREIPVRTPRSKKVDYANRLRSDKEKARRAAKETERKRSDIKQQLEEEQSRQSGALDQQFYEMIFRDPSAEVELASPLEFPSLEDEQELHEIKIRDAFVSGREVDRGLAIIRLLASGATEFAAVHLVAGNTVYTAVINPATGRVSLREGDEKFDWLK